MLMMFLYFWNSAWNSVSAEKCLHVPREGSSCCTGRGQARPDGVFATPGQLLALGDSLSSGFRLSSYPREGLRGVEMSAFLI